MTLAIKHGQWFQWFVYALANLWSAATTNGFVGFLPFLFFGFLQIVNKVASRTIRTKTNGMVCPAQICLVFGMASHCAQFSHAVGELAFFAILAGAMFTERSAKFGLVAAGVDLGGGGAGGGGGGGGGVAVAVIDFVFQAL